MSSSPLVVRPSPVKNLGLGLLCLLFAVIGLVIGGIPGWLVAVLCGAAAVYALQRAVRRPVALIVDDEGLIDSASWLGQGRIPWDDIADAEAVKVGKSPTLVLHLVDGASVLEKNTEDPGELADGEELDDGDPAVMISWRAFSTDLETVVAEIKSRLQERGATPSA